MLPGLFLLGCDSGEVGGQRAVFIFVVGCSLSSQIEAAVLTSGPQSVP